MSIRSMFIYKVDIDVATYIIIAPHPGEAAKYVNSLPDKIEITKLGCVTADVHDNTEPGIVVREWKTAA